MRIVVFGDLHGNLPALEALLAAARRARADEVVSLGNAVGAGPHPGEVVDLLRKRQVTCLLGPQEAALRPQAGATAPAETVEHNRRALPAKDQRFLATLPDSRRLAFGGCRLLLAWTWWTGALEPVRVDAPPGTLADWLRQTRTEMACVGGSPAPFVRDLPGDLTLAAPGPAGLNPDGPEAPYLLLDGETLKLEVRHAAYDPEPLLRDMLKAGLPLDPVPPGIRHGF